MYLRHTTVRKDGKTHSYWRLVRSVRRGRKVVQETVAQLGELDAQGRARARTLALRITGGDEQYELFEATTGRSDPVTVRLDQIRLERARRFGDVWLGWRLWHALALDGFCSTHLVEGRERVPWSAMAAILVIARLCEPSSELHIAEDWYRRTALDDCGRAGRARQRRSAVPRPRPPAAAQGSAGGPPQGAPGSAVRARLRAVAVRRDEHLFRGPGAAQCRSPAAATAATIGPTASRFASAWW